MLKNQNVNLVSKRLSI